MKKTQLIIGSFIILFLMGGANHSRIPAGVDWKAELIRIDGVINERELRSDALPQAIAELTAYHERYPRQADVLSRLAKCYYFIGKFSQSKKKKLDAYKRGFDYSQKALAIEPNHLEGNFWHGINIGRYSSTKGALSALNNVRKIVASMEKVISIDPKFKNAGAHIVLGRVYLEAPGRPFSIGNKKKALEHLQKAKELDPNYYETRLYLMELYDKQKKSKLAKAEAEWIITTPFEDKWPVSARRVKEKAQELLKKYRNK
ncbi:TRAP transporter TatT component family protein [Bdellovibrionota bacterium]